MSESKQERTKAGRPSLREIGQQRTNIVSERTRYCGKQADCVFAGYCEPIPVGSSPDLGAGDYLRFTGR